MIELPKHGITLASQVAQILQDAIMKGEMKPGERVLQDTVAKQLGVSRIPVRLAFEMLQNRGLITLNPHKGAIVSELSPDELKEIFEVRAFIEGMAIEKSLPKLKDDDLDKCEKIIRQMRIIDDANEWIELNKKFHGILNSHFTSGNINEIISTLRANAERYVRVALLVIDRFEEYDNEHEAILKACRERDVEKAKHLVQIHLKNTASVLEEYLKNKDAGDETPST